MRFSVLLVLTAGISGAANTTTNPQVTFTKDVLPILQKNCQTCHRPGEVAPMAFLNYKGTRPWAKAIKTAVLTTKMPPWFADARYGHFGNERRLTSAETDTLVHWADSGAPEGDAKDAPKPLAWVNGWNIGNPDVVFEMPKPFELPASGTIEYQYLVIPGGFLKDTWIKAAEVRPGNRVVVHHVIAFIRPAGSRWLKDARPGVPYDPRAPRRDANGAEVPDAQRGNRRENEGMLGAEFLVGYAPGLQPQRFDLADDSAKLIPPGSDIVLQMHYTANRAAAADATKIGLVLAKEPPRHRYLTLNAANVFFAIPPNNPNSEVHSKITLQDSAELVWLMPHMHLRGKDFVNRAVYPSGESETLLNVPKFDFNWQLGYDEAKPLALPKGTRIECTAHFDNSVNNAANPNSAITVRWGDQSWEEMMIGWFAVVIDAKRDPSKLFRAPSAGD